MLHKKVDKVYGINLPSSVERRENLERECYKIGTQFKLVPAIDGVAENVAWYETGYAKDVHGWTQGAAGLVYTTINIIEEAKRSGYEKILILEDDIVFTPNVTEVFNQCIDELPDNWELFHLAAQHFVTPQRCGRSLLGLRGAWSCQAYAVHANVFDEYLKWLKLVDRPIDSITGEIIHPKGNSYSTIANQIITVPNMSTIRKSFMNYNV